MRHEDIANFIKKQKERFGITGSLSEEQLRVYLETTSMSREEFIFTLITLYVNSITESERIRSAYNDEHNKNAALNKTVEELKSKVGMTGRQVQMAKVRNGAQYNKKHGTVNELRVLKEMGLTDEQIMQRYGISKSTMWRWKKQAEGVGEHLSK